MNGRPEIEAVLAYRREYRDAAEIDISIACGVPLKEVYYILTHQRFNLDWSLPVLVQTRFGERGLRTAPPTGSFWKAWHDDKEALKAAGYSVSKKDEVWQVCHWAEVAVIES